MIGMPIAQVLVGVDKWARSALLEPGFPANNCIQATRTLQEVFMHFGYYTRPLTVHAYIHNPPLWAAIKRHAETGEGKVPNVTDPDYEKRGFWGLGIKKGNPGRGWDGHLVLYVEHDDLKHPSIIDGSFDQFSRPDKKLAIPPTTVIAYVPDDFADRQQQAAMELPTGVGVIYESQPRDHTYIRAPDWMQFQNRPLYTKVRDRIIRAVEEEARS